MQNRIVKRIFPTRPKLGIALVLLILAQGVAFADYIVRDSRPLYGGFGNPQDYGSATCDYVRNPDTCSGAGTAQNISCVFVANGHHKNWWAYKNIQGQCVATPDHFYNDGQWVSGTFEK